MAGRRLPLHRIAGIAAWTAASVAWGTAAVALANHEPATESADHPVDLAFPSAIARTDLLPAVPTMPESGLIVLRYTPTELPEPEVIVRTVSVPGTTRSAEPAARERSSGS